MAVIKKTIEVALEVPIEVVIDGQTLELTKLTLYRPTLKQAKDLAVIGGKEFAKILLKARDSGNAEVDFEKAVEDIADTLLTKDSLSALTDVLAEMTHEKPEVIDCLDWLDIPALVKGAAGFFPKLQSGLPPASAQN